MNLINITKKVLMIAIVSTGLFACDDYEFLGSEVREVRDLNDFNKLQLSTVGKVYLKSSSDYRIEIWTNEGLMDNIDTYVDAGGTLRVQFHGHIRKIKHLEYYVFMPYLNQITLNGVCDVFCYEGFETDNLIVDQENVGTIQLDNLSLDQVNVNLNDVGDINLSGAVETGNFNLRGVGDINALELITNHASASLTGVGDISLNVNSSLEIYHSGVGKVYYKGDPAIDYHGDSHLVHVAH